ncbi:MAG: hypothetical protein EA402_14790 [Planctomycetota bacterium]|nr:MAG: hypothetical protein EA402_14790 [Planctomycetota bacterium]
MAGLIRLGIAIALAFTLLPWAAAVFMETWIGRPRWLPQQDPWWVVGGLALAVPLVLWKRPNALVHTAIHELCHAILCLVLLVRVTSFRVTDGQGGAVGHERVDPLRGTIISLAPYTLPLLLLPLLVTRMYITDPGYLRGALSAGVAFFYIHHLHALYFNIRINMWGSQADLVKSGRPLSAVVIASVLLLVTTWVLRVLA